MNFEEIKHKLDTKALPGWKSHEKIALKGTMLLSHEEIRLKEPRELTALVLFYKESKKIKLALMLRNPDDKNPSPEISFLKGKKEKVDETLIDTVRREVFREIHIPGKKINLIGNLSEVYVPLTNHMVYPFVGSLNEKLKFIRSKKGDKELISTSLEELEKIKIMKKSINVENYVILAPCFKIKSHLLWGTNAMIMQELKDVIFS